MEIDFLDVWELVHEGDVVVTILCKLCKEIGKEQRPIKSDAKENMMSLGEQHLFFRHQRDPIGYPRKTDFYPLQCSACQWFFPVQRILDSHAKTCDGLVGRLRAVENVGQERNNNDEARTNKNAATVVNPAAGATKKKSSTSVVVDQSSLVKYESRGVLDKAPALSSPVKAALKRYKIHPCKVLVVRCAEVQSAVMERKLVQNTNDVFSKKRKKNPATSV